MYTRGKNNEQGKFGGVSGVLKRIETVFFARGMNKEKRLF